MTAPQYTETNLIDNWDGSGTPWPNFESRNGTPVVYWVIHTTEGDGGMDLVRYMAGAEVSYHYVVDNDGTVYDLVDTDDASWSCLGDNPRTINAVFGTSFAAWTRQDWLNNCGNAIPIMAWLCAQDLHKYGIPPVLSLGPNYTPIDSGVVDHRYFTVVVQDGNTHTDVGDGFPGDVFNAHLQAAYAALAEPASTPTPAPSPAPIPAPPAPTQTGAPPVADPQSIANANDGIDATGHQLPWRIVHLLREATIGDLSTQTDGDVEVPNASSSLYDQVATLAKILTRRYKGKDVFDLLAEIHDTVVTPPTPSVTPPA